MIIKAHFDGKTIVPDEPVSLPVNQPLRLDVYVDAESVQIDSDAKLLLFSEMIRAADGAAVADWSRESIYSGRVDELR